MTSTRVLSSFAFVKEGFSHVRGSKVPLNFDTIPQFLRKAGAATNGRKLISFPEEGIDKTVNEFVQDVEETAVALLNLGFGSGKRCLFSVLIFLQEAWVSFFVSFSFNF